ncbi:hypothetical protein Stube_28950 [Streptomyces tubercidicus]|uniref:Uncharacterized protein n=1 Tax=Streptomyces tubercidicus TaxID=47759 RepID=A0A640US70_9ACTN|nr:hypothetical protein Stube_28950 [Streptomyces tubercidicus]
MGDLQGFRLDGQTGLLASRGDPTHQGELGLLAALEKNLAPTATAITHKAAWNKQQAPPRTRTETVAPTRNTPRTDAASTERENPRSDWIRPGVSTEPPSGFEPETYALRGGAGSSRAVPRDAAESCFRWSGERSRGSRDTESPLMPAGPLTQRSRNTGQLHAESTICTQLITGLPAMVHLPHALAMSRLPRPLHVPRVPR